MSDEERLHGFESLTDTALAYLGTEDLLVELLDRLRETLKADTSVVLLMDESGSHLESTVARGLDQAVHHAIRVRVGEGFLGRVAAEGKPMALEDVAHDDGTGPIVFANGSTSVLAVPLVAQGTTIGVLQIGSLEPRQFTEDDVNLLRSAGDRMALAIETRTSSAQLSAAIMLQRSLVPSRLPPIAGLTTAARYVPGGGGAVGGDWYDLFTLPTGHVCFAVGDVVGNGLTAAVVMGRLRSALRAYALVSLDPAEVLTQLNRKLRHFERFQMATVLYGVLDPMLERVQLSSAGHPPAMLALPGMPVVDVEVPADPPVGVSLNAPRRTTAVDLPRGGLLCLYTDGLVERRGEHLEEGLARLRGVLTPGDPDDLCNSVMNALVGRAEPKDDVAMLVVKREEVQKSHVLVVPAERTVLARIRVALRRWLTAAGATETAIGDLLVSVGEAVANSVEHAYGAAGGLVEVSMELGKEEVRATIRDNGSWRPPRGHSRGRGMLLMERLSDEVRIDRGTTGTEVTIRRQLRREGNP